MADAELLIKPEIARQAMNETMQELERNFDKLAKNVQQDFEKSIAKGTSDGAKKGIRGAGQQLKRAYSATGGMRAAVAGGIIGIGMAGFFDTIARAEGGTALMSGLLGGENQAAQSLALARQSGMDSSEYSQLTQNMRAGGMVNAEDMNAIIFDLNARVGEGISGEDPLLEQFGKFQGADRVNAILASIGTQDKTQAIKTLDQLGFAGDATALLSMLDQAKGRAGASGKTLFEELGTVSEKAIKAGEELESEAAKAQKFRDEMLEHEREYRKKFLDEINDGDISAFFKDKRQKDDDQVEIMRDYQTNIENANEAQADIKKGLTVMRELTKDGFEVVGDIRDFITKWAAEGAISNAIDSAIEEASKEISNSIDELNPF